MLNRRKFLQQSVLTAGSVSLSLPVIARELEDLSEVNRLTILHTNDTHSRIDPFPMDGTRNQGLGGVAARSQLINQIRKEGDQVLLLDAGDIFQGTPYFNLYKGEPEIKAMSEMQYDATTIGNHDFDAGLENLANQLTRHATFPMLVCNYNFSQTPMEYQYEPYKIFKKGKLKVGVLGVGIEMKGLIADNLIEKAVYSDPVRAANETAYFLKKQKDCDLVICLSHLGFQYKEDKISDERLAQESENIDLIIGGHTHTFFDAPLRYNNKQQKEVIVNQVGFGGIVLGRLDFEFSKFSKRQLVNSTSIKIISK
ncbi:MAG: bifunctional metallophosphatase/5'-nucleotidase [Chitinophagaceae bacterium]|nr:MAG: bifunctional metallophosphatase/5'-nucleotidase [Chitinophagaceae bacterium]